MDAPSPIPVPSYNIQQIFRLRRKLIDVAFLLYHGFVPTGEDFDVMVDTVRPCLPRVKRAVLYDSLLHLAGQEMTPDVIKTTAWRLAGNLARLRGGHPVKVWSCQIGCEWAPVAVESQRLEERYGKAGSVLELRFLAGSPATMSLSCWRSNRFCAMLSRRVGFSRSRGNFPYHHPSELTRLRFMVLLDPTLTRDGSPGFDKIVCPSGLMKWNRNLIGLRCRRYPSGAAWPCPEGFTHQCYQCPVGFDRCPAAVHAVTVDSGEENAIVDENKLPV